ncbi:MAG: ParB/RepB/Spo0J family partition protein [Chloroflexi bacterium]|nr:ParB/RepB/Spo0J family partition protein [Chloroflexota bacterium]
MTTATKHGLGRGLGALIPQRAVSETASSSGVREIQIAQIEPNPHQPRKRFANETLDELAASIREHGMIQPLVLKEITTPYGSRYQLIAGERRWRAAQRAGFSTVPAIVKGATPQQMLELALVENVQRADLNALEEAEAYRQLIQEFELTQEQVAQKVGKDRTTVSNALRLLKMPEALKDAVLNESISEGHARALMQIPEEAKQEKLLTHVVNEHLSVRQTEELVRRTLAMTISHRPKSENGNASNVKRHPSPVTRHSPDTHALEEDLRRALGTKVELYRSQRGGKIIIEFYSDEELEAIYDKLVGR